VPKWFWDFDNRDKATDCAAMVRRTPTRSKDGSDAATAASEGAGASGLSERGLPADGGFDGGDAARRIAELEAALAERDRTIAELRLAEGRLRSLLDGLRDIVFYRGEPSGEVYVFGTQAETIAPRIETDGRIDLDAWYTSILPEDREAYLEAERRRREFGEPFTIEFRYIHPEDGRLAWARECAYAVPTGDGRQFNDGFIIDITEAKLRDQQRREATEAAMMANRAKSEFLANVSHELRTPLNAVIGFAEILIAEAFGPLGSGKYREYASDIHASAVHLKQLIEDILDVSKVEAGKAELYETRVDLERVIGVVLRIIRSRATAKRLALEPRLAQRLPQVMADEPKLRQILINLLSNAVKFTPEGGSVTVEATRDVGGRVVITVTDTGIGMAPEDVPVAMEPFRQLHGGLSRSFEGTGLGLPLSLKLAQLHGGTLEVESAPGEGTSVRLVLPAERTVLPVTRAAP